MNSRERMAAAMNMMKPDRTPFMCQMSIGHMLRQLNVSPVEFWFDEDIFADGLLRLREIYGFDGILISLHGHNPDWRKEIASRTPTPEGERVALRDGQEMIFPVNDLPQPVNEIRSKIPISDIEIASLPGVLDYIPVSQGLHFGIDQRNKFGVIDKIVGTAGKDYSIHGEITSPFDYFLDLVGHQDGLIALIEMPDKSKEVLDHFARLIESLAVEMCGTGIDAIKISSPFAGASFISPSFYSEFVLPFERRIVHAIRNKGVHAYLHTCGVIGDRLKEMYDSGISGIECLDPPPLGNVELQAAIEIARGKGFIKGNIDSVSTLLCGSKDEILKDARARLDTGKRGTGFILSTACSIAPEVRRENILLLKDAVERWG